MKKIAIVSFVLVAALIALLAGFQIRAQTADQAWSTFLGGGQADLQPNRIRIEYAEPEHPQVQPFRDMLIQHRVSLAEAQRAIEKGVEEASKDGKPMAFVVADAGGDVICSLRMDGAHARVLKHAVRKAFTAAVMQRDTLAFETLACSATSSMVRG